MIAPAAWLLDLLYPPKCVACGKLLQKGEQDVCNACRLELPVNPVPVDCEGFFDVCLAPFRYEGTMRDALLRYKFGGQMHYAAFFADHMAPLICEKLEGEFDLLSWVPISRRRKRERGFDQAKLLARLTGKRLGIRAVATLKKVRHTQRQSQLSDKSMRVANVRNAYRAVSPEQLRGKRVLLIDDVITTGATLSECSEVLLRAGAAQVLCAAAATAHNRRKNRVQ